MQKRIYYQLNIYEFKKSPFNEIYVIMFGHNRVLGNKSAIWLSALPHILAVEAQKEAKNSVFFSKSEIINYRNFL